MFHAGFEKEAGLKHWLTAAAIAGTPMKAKADMASTLKDAVGKTQIGREVSSNANKAVDKLRSVRLFGEKAATSAGGKVTSNASSAAKSAKPSLDIKDGNSLEFKYNKFKARAKPGETAAELELPKGAKMTLADRGGNKSFSVGFEKEF